MDNECVTFKTNLKPFDLLAAFVRPSNAIKLYWKTMRAIIEIKNAQTIHDVEKRGNTYQLKRPKRNKYYAIQKII